jgi:ABC-type oligopeptide transport system ATPase subunit
MIFQDPQGSLNPRQSVRATLSEILKHVGSKKTPLELLEAVGLDSSHLDKYPHEFSGGQRQRICIARAIALESELLICDEAVSALDLSIRSQILDLLMDLKKRFNLSLMFITHDLGVVKHIADRVIVMKAGKIVECASCNEIITNPQHDYTKKLISSVLSL